MNIKMLSFRILLVFSFFLYPIVLGNISLLCYLAIYGIPCLYFFLHYKKTTHYLSHFPVSLFNLFVCILFFLSASLLLPFLYGTYDFSYVNTVLAIVRKLIIYIFLLMIVANHYKDNQSIEHFMLYHSLATVLYVIGTIVFLLYPELRNIWISILQVEGRNADLIEQLNYITRFGWSGYSGFRNTISCSLSIVFLTYLFSSKESQLLLKIKWYIILALFCFLGNMFYGRSGLLVSALCILFGLFIYQKISCKLIFQSLVAMLLLVFLVSSIKESSDAIYAWYQWVTVPFENLYETGSFNNASFDHLVEDMIFMPEVNTFLFGDGMYTSSTGLYYMNTDAGFMRQILFWGIFFTSAMYLMWLITLFIMKRSFGLKIMFLILCVIFEFKGECYYQMLPLFLSFYAIDLKNTNKYKGCNHNSTLLYN